MINNNQNTNNQGQDQGSGNSGDSQNRSALQLALPQGAFLASLLGPVQPDPSSSGNTDLSSAVSGSAAAMGTVASDHSALFGLLEAQNLQQPQHLNAESSRSSLNTGSFNTGTALPNNQSSHQNESIASLFSQPKQNLTNLDQGFGMNPGSVAGPEIRSFFGSNNVQDLGSMSHNQSSSGGGFGFSSNNVQANFPGSGGLLGQQNANIHSLSGNLPVQNTLNFNNAISLSAQETLKSQMSLHNVLNNSWQQQIQQPLQVQQQQSLQQQLLLQQQQQQQQQLEEQLSLQQQAQHSRDAPGNDSASTSLQQLPPEIKWKGRGRSSTFPLKLHQMLLDLEKQEGGTSIACFLPHGRGFQIHKPKEFSKEIMPNYFRMSTYSSFQRQLNLYDFQRISEGPEKGAYWHELFLKDQPMLSTNMKRSKVKGATRARQEERQKNYELQKDQHHH